MRHMLSRKPPKCLRKLYFVFLKWPLEIFRDAKAFNELQLNFIFFLVVSLKALLSQIWELLMLKGFMPMRALVTLPDTSILKIIV